MTDKEPDTKADIVPAEDRGEGVGAMEPMLVGSSSHYRGQLGDLAVEVAERSAGLRRSLPDGVVTALSDLVRAMNCYYSNLIEGHGTHPIDIERALNNDFSADAAQRDLRQIIVGAHATDDDVRILCGLGRADRDRAAIGFGPAFRLADGSVVDRQLMPGLRQMSSHRSPHGPQADKRDPSHPASYICVLGPPP